ncbi:MAG: hypothetical protein IAG13_25290 [Deltaproteobacteria bacterium]|nr:hypothetical protein [Nannocystaceae bacterium]
MAQISDNPDDLEDARVRIELEAAGWTVEAGSSESDDDTGHRSEYSGDMGSGPPEPMRIADLAAALDDDDERR